MAFIAGSVGLGSKNLRYSVEMMAFDFMVIKINNKDQLQMDFIIFV